MREAERDLFVTYRKERATGVGSTTIRSQVEAVRRFAHAGELLLVHAFVFP